MNEKVLDKGIEDVLSAACELFLVKRKDLFNKKHERQMISLARKIIFFMLIEKGYKKEFILEYFDFSKDRFNYLYKCAQVMHDNKHHIFTFNYNNIIRLCSIK